MSDQCGTCGGSIPKGGAFCPSCGMALSARPLAVDVTYGEGALVGSIVEIGGSKRNRKRDALVVGAGTIVLIGALALSGKSSASKTAIAVTTTVAATTAPTTPTTSGASVASTTDINGVTIAPSTIAGVTGVTIAPSSTNNVEELGPLLNAPTHTTLLTIDSQDRVRKIDLDTGRAETLPYNLQLGNSFVQVGATLVTVNNNQQGSPSLSLIRAGQKELSVRGLTAVRVPGTNQFWSFDADYNLPLTHPPELRLYDEFGHDVQKPVALPSQVESAQPIAKDLVLLTAMGGVYALALPSQRISRVGTGQVRESHFGGAQIFECDDRIRCFLRRIDGAAKTVSRVPMPSDGQQYGYGSTVASPDGRFLAEASYDSTGVHGRITAADGTVLWPVGNSSKSLVAVVGGDNWGSWSSDSKWFFTTVRSTATGTAVVAWHEGLADVIEVPHLGGVQYVTVIP